MSAHAAGPDTVSRRENLEANDLARQIVDIASEKQAEDIVMLDIRDMTPFADYFVIMSAESRRQLNALEEDLVQTLKQSGILLRHREGKSDTGWVLLDYGDVVVHLFGAEQREFYRLEQFWSQAPQVVRIL